MIDQYPWLWWITAGWVIVLIGIRLLHVSRPVVMRYLSVWMLLSFLGISVTGIYMIFFGFVKIFSLSIIQIHITAGYIFTLAALSHVTVHWRELWGYAKKILRLT